MIVGVLYLNDDGGVVESAKCSGTIRLSTEVMT